MTLNTKTMAPNIFWAKDGLYTDKGGDITKIRKWNNPEKFNGLINFYELRLEHLDQINSENGRFHLLFDPSPLMKITIPQLVDFKFVVTGDFCTPTARNHEYLCAGNGIFIQTETEFFYTVIPVEYFEVPIEGLLPIRPVFLWKKRKVDQALLSKIYQDSLNASKGEIETLHRLQFDPQCGEFEAELPIQDMSTTLVKSADVGSVQTPIEIHSHHRMPTYFSNTDDKDHQGTRIYGVMGDFGKNVPRLSLRVGVNGHRMPIRVPAVFRGLGPFWDLNTEVRYG